jgi:hypothetical protein
VFLGWAKRVESNTSCMQLLAELMMRELADGAHDSTLSRAEVAARGLSATSFRQVLHAMNLSLTLDDIRMLFREANPSGRPDILSFQGLLSLLDKHL